MLVHHDGKVGQQTYDTYFHAAPAQDTIRLHDFLQSRIVKIIVGTDYRKPAPAYPARQFVQTVVKLVVSQTCRIISHGIHAVHFHIAFHQREIR